MRRHFTRIAAATLVALVWWITELPTVPGAERQQVARSFSFDSAELNSIPVDGYQTERAVAPRLKKLQTWISGAGASIALTDLTGDGLANDLCLVDPRTDTVTVQSVQPNSRAYPAFIVDAGELPFDRATTAPTGCLPGDFNEDGWTDLLLYYWGRAPVTLTRRPDAPLAAGAFFAAELVDEPERWYTNSVTQVDIDGDGHVDLIIGNYFPDGSRLLDPTATDDPDFAMNDTMSLALNGGRNRILLHAGTTPGGAPRYTDASDALTDDQARAWTLAIGAQDLSGDSLPDLYFANDFGPDRLLINDGSTPGQVRLTEVKGRKDFTTPKSKVLGYDSFKGMGIDFGDLTGDGLTDMFVSNISSRRGLMETNFAWINTGGDLAPGVDAPFADRSDDLGVARSGWGWDAKIADFDNNGVSEIVQTLGFVEGEHDAWPQVAELAMANDWLVRHPEGWMQLTDGWGLAHNAHPAFFARNGDRFIDVGSELGFDRQGITRAIATGDVDGDGRLDLAIAGQWTGSYLYRNQSPDGGASLGLRLLREVAGEPGATIAAEPAPAGDTLRGTPAIGAVVTVTLPDGTSYHQQVDGGNGHASARSTELHFGLGEVAATAALRLDIEWNSVDGPQRTVVHVTPGRWAVVLGG